jgi:metal-responsive CopG/Arc/MetJ family transcriptional regulator
MSAVELLAVEPRRDRTRRALVIPGYTGRMKSAISVPDEVFALVEERAAALGMSRSEFFTRAARHYLAQLDADSLTGQVDAALALIGTDESSHAAADAGHRLLATSEDEW